MTNARSRSNEIPWREFLKCLVETVIGIKNSVQRVRNQLTVQHHFAYSKSDSQLRRSGGRKLLNLQSLVSNHRIIWWDLFFHGFERSIDTTCNRTKKILVGRSYVKGISQRRTVSTVNRLNRGKFKYLKRKENRNKGADLPKNFKWKTGVKFCKAKVWSRPILQSKR